MKRALAVLLSLGFLLAAVVTADAAEQGSEDRLRRRVKRFYVLNYLNRYGEMWELFSDDLRERLGGDRQDYVKSTRLSGFELYSSRIEEIRLKGGVASVEVVVQAQLAGALEVTSRRHRMLWRFEDSDWRYAGSIDVTHSGGGEEPVETAELQPPSRARPPEVEQQELLPPRVRVETQAPVPPPREEAQRSDAKPGERWDLVAVPPPGREAPATAGESQAPSDSAAPAPPGKPSTPAAVAEPVRNARAEPELSDWLPPERASAPPAPPEPPAGETTVGSADALGEGSQLVRKAVSGNLPRRTRAIAKLRSLNEPRLAPLMAESIPGAPASTAEFFLGELARYRAFGEADVVVRTLSNDRASLRSAAALALVRLGDGSHATALAAALDAEGDDAAFAQELLAYAAVAGEAAGPRIAGRLADQQAGQPSRSAAAQAAGRCGCEEVEGPLLALLRRERKAAVARVALLAAGRLGGEESIALLEAVAEKRLRLPAEAGDDLDGELEARRGLALAGVPGAGEALAALLLHHGMRAFSEDVVLVASTGELEALLSLLAHPEPAIRRRAADLLGRVIETEEDAAQALVAVEAALIDEGDIISFDALLDAKERLQAPPAS